MKPRGGLPRINRVGVLAFTVAYVASVMAGESLYGSLNVPSPFWFPDSVLLCALLFSRKEEWWIWMVILWPVRLATGPPPGTPLWFLVASIVNDSLKGIIAAWWLRRLRPEGIDLTTLREYAIFLGVTAGAVPLMSALAAAPMRYALGDSLWSAGYQWFLGDAVAHVVVTPALLYWYSGFPRGAHQHRRELVMGAGGLLVTLYLAFVVPHETYSPIVIYAPVPFLIWAAVRLRPFGTANAIGMVALVSMLSAVKGTGVFAGHSSNETLLSMQLFLILVAVSSLSLAILMAERENKTRQLEESEGRFRLVADTAPMLIWMSGTDTLCTYFSRSWLDFTGRTLEEELGNGWSAGVHPHDLQGCMQTYVSAFEARQEFEMEYRLRRHDGKFRWLVHRGVPSFESDGVFRGYIGSCIDLTERKLAEREMQALGGRLIHAQEEERARIARELHDDISQRMAILQIRAERFGQSERDLSEDASREWQVIVNLASELLSDVTGLSHRLHPSVLDILGLVAALKGLCREVSEQHRVKVHFVHRDMPAEMAKDVSTCVFRIVQEALRNVVKHSGVTDAMVELSGNDEHVELCITDAGKGFEPDDLDGKLGLGLISMRERLRRVGGELVIVSAPSHGTRIRVSAPAHLPVAATAAGFPELT